VIAGRLQVHPTTVGRALRGVAHPPATCQADQADQVEAVPTLVEVEVADLGGTSTPREN
jgi:hypothetical protein